VDNKKSQPLASSINSPLPKGDKGGCIALSQINKPAPTPGSYFIRILAEIS